MSATILTAEAAKAANIDIISNGKYTQAVHETVVALRANRRSGTASVKTTATVNGSGSKPWKQKGTGRARAGSRQSPIWVGGGVVFGPHPRDYSKKVSKKTKRVALRKALSAKIKAGGGKATLTTVQGEALTVSGKGNKLKVTDAKGNVAKITIGNVYQKNGVIQVVDRVLLPK